VAWWSLSTANLEKLQQLSCSERWLLFQAFLMLPLVALGLRGFGLRQVHAILANCQPRDQNPRLDSGTSLLPRARAIARLVQVAARYGLGRPKCLAQSLTLWWLLRRQKIAGELRIGVKPTGDRVEAHAWVEFQGIILNDSQDVHLRFTPFKETIIPQ
jgi:hypothetical protein